MASSGTLLALFIFAGIFILSIVITLVLWRHWKRPTEEKTDARQEAEYLRARAEMNAENAAEIESRAKRLEHLLSIQRRDRPGGRR